MAAYTITLTRPDGEPDPNNQDVTRQDTVSFDNQSGAKRCLTGLPAVLEGPSGNQEVDNGATIGPYPVKRSATNGKHTYNVKPSCKDEEGLITRSGTIKVT